ncbi:hypothetical protein HN924_00300 [Candidatus Woesearchaeota archaeon]|jgi:hypothetical protein|nr:hypothetical protein [Candidatus Woesearchaeota archaeon]MBT7062392.1 hypothetical protein [Candidatus Woesearchaeota archaeon]MBT7402549.1 hypothetical protein [Candidatus Woesearchaeota archaeon]
MSRVEKWKLKRYLKRVRKAYRKMYKKTDADMRGHFFYNLHRTETLLQQLLTENKDIVKLKNDIKHKVARQKIIRAKIKNLVDKVKIRREAELNFQDIIHEKRLLSKEYGLLVDEENELRREVNKSTPALEKALKKELENQFKILLSELEIFEIRVKERVAKGDITKRSYKWNFKRYIEPLKKYHHTFWFN